MHTPAQRFRHLLARPGLVRLAGAHNALGATLVARSGFDGVWSSGLEISTAHAVPDASILTMSDYLAAAQQMAAAVDIPVVADCDTGYGNSNNVMRMVRTFEAAGVAAVCIEDKLFPKVNSLTSGRQELASVAEFVGKILAAKAAQRTTDFAVIARIEALIAGWPVAEALRRADAYARAGADAILVHDKHPDGAGLREFLAQWTGRLPIVVVPTAFPAVTGRELESLGAKVVIYANHGLRAAVRAMDETYRRIIAEDGIAGVEPTVAPLSQVFELQGMPALRQAERDFLRSGMPPTRAVIISAGAHRNAKSMDAVSADVPMAALDVAGRSLVQRQVDVLAAAGVRDVVVVTGYRHELVRCDGATLVRNADWEQSGEAVSVMTAPDAPAGHRTLVLYGDILFDADLVRRVLASDADATAVVDRGPPADRNGDTKPRDLVTLSPRPAPTSRPIAPGRARQIACIAPTIAPSEADGEFAGIALFAPAGWAALRTAFADGGPARERAHDAERNSTHAAGRDHADRRALPELLRQVIDAGTAVEALEVTQGWLEIHSLADYQAACALVTR